MIKQNEINLNGVDLIKLTQVAYDLSVPQGLGFLHSENGSLSQEEAKDLVDPFSKDKNIALGLDYVKGRAVKLNVFRDGEKSTCTEVGMTTPIWTWKPF